MKKFLLSLPFLALSITAMAQDKPTTMPQSIIDAAVKRFEPTFCHESIEKQMEVVYKCYQNTKANEPKYSECNLGDRLLTGHINREHKEAIALGKPDPYPNIPPFFQQSVGNQRTLELMNILLAQGYNKQDRVSYLHQAFKNFNAKITQLCNQ